MSKLVIMNVTNRGGNMLDHSPLAEWPVFPGITPNAVYIQLGNNQFRLRTIHGYNNRGGINNSDMGRWINAHYPNTRGLKLLFDVSYDQASMSITYTLKGQFIPL